MYGYFTDPEKMLTWKGVAATLDPRPGGIYRVNVTGREVVSGRYVELEPFHRIVFTWGWEGEGRPLPPGSTTVEVTLAADGDATVLRLRHSGLAPELLRGHADGWGHFLPRLAIAAAGGDAGPDPWAIAPRAAADAVTGISA